MGCSGAPLVTAALLALVVGHVSGTSCAPDACARTPCDASITEHSCSKGEFRKRGSVCRCCDVCIPYADEDEDCTGAVVPVGFPPKVVCKPPLQCVDGFCKKQVASCATTTQGE